MWIFLNQAFLSIVAHRTEPSSLLVRARVRGDLERAFPGAKVSRTPDADYLFRATVTRSRVASMLFDQALELSYQNFKGSVPDRDRLATYHDVWDVMLDWQVRRADAERAPRFGGEGLPEPCLVTGDLLLTRTGLSVDIERVQNVIGADPIVSFRYVRSGKRFTYPLRMARRWLRGSTLLDEVSHE